MQSSSNDSFVLRFKFGSGILTRKADATFVYDNEIHCWICSATQFIADSYSGTPIMDVSVERA